MFCGTLGGILGVVAMFTMPEFPANSIIPAIAYGIVSGLAATGLHQLVKQLIKFIFYISSEYFVVLEQSFIATIVAW